jgi:hypothetical protein
MYGFSHSYEYLYKLHNHSRKYVSKIFLSLLAQIYILCKEL